LSLLVTTSTGDPTVAVWSNSYASPGTVSGRRPFAVEIMKNSAIRQGPRLRDEGITMVVQARFVVMRDASAVEIPAHHIEGSNSLPLGGDGRSAIIRFIPE